MRFYLKYSLIFADDGIFEPRTNVINFDDYYVLEFEIAGVKAESMELKVARENVVLEGIKEADIEGEVLISERRFGYFKKEIALPHPCTPESAKSELKDGILIVKLKKER